MMQLLQNNTDLCTDQIAGFTTEGSSHLLSLRRREGMSANYTKLTLSKQKRMKPK